MAQPTNISARHSAGQTFLTWDEAAAYAGDYRIFRETSQITTLSGLTAIATVETGSWEYLYTSTALIVEDDGAGLDSDTGLAVITTYSDETGNWFYAVCRTDDNTLGAGNSLASPVSETYAAVPGMVRLEPPEQPSGPGTNFFYRYMGWEDIRTWDTPVSGYYGNLMTVTTPASIGANNWLQVHFHAAGDTGFFVPLETTSIDADRIFMAFCDYDWSGDTDPYTGTGHRWSVWYGNETDSVVQKNTVLRIRRYVQWVIANATFDIDATRVYAQGASYGGGGSMHWTLENPDLIAGAIPSIGWTNSTNLGSLDIGYDALDTIDGPSWLNQMDQEYLIDNFVGDAPPIVYTYNKNDGTVSPSGYPDLFTAYETKKQAYATQWGQDGHNQFYLTGAWSVERFKKDESYPAFANCSTSDSPAGDDEGQRNVNLDWQSALRDLSLDDIVDESDTYEISLKSLDGDCTSDVTIRNTQAFIVSSGQTVNWSTADDDGSVTADAHGKVTIEDLPIKAAGTRLVLEAVSAGSFSSIFGGVVRTGPNP